MLHQDGGRKKEINTLVVALNKLFYFSWAAAIVVWAEGFKQPFCCCCWTLQHNWLWTGSIGAILYCLCPSSNFFSLPLPRPPRVAPRPRTTPAGAAPPTPFPMSLNTATLFTDMEKFLCRVSWTSQKKKKKKERGMWGMWAHRHICQLNLYEGEIPQDRAQTV